MGEIEPFESPGAPPAQPAGPAVLNDPAEVSRVSEFAERHFPLLEFGKEVDLSSQDYPIAWIEQALERAKSAKARRWAYVAAILRDWQVNGKPERASATGAGKPLSRAERQIAEARLAVAKAKAANTEKDHAG